MSQQRRNLSRHINDQIGTFHNTGGEIDSRGNPIGGYAFVVFADGHVDDRKYNEPEKVKLEGRMYTAAARLMDDRVPGHD